MSWTILDSVLDDIDRALAEPRPEQGGALLMHAAMPQTIVRFLHDPDAEVSSVSYRCSASLARVVAALEGNSGFRLAGIAHSHPAGIDSPSSQDERAFLQTLSRNPWMGHLLVPIVTQTAARLDHETSTEHGKVSWYEARSLGNRVEVREAEVRIMPLARDLRELTTALGVTCEEPQFVLVEGLGYAMVALGAAVDRLGREISHILIPPAYPWQAPLALVRDLGGGETRPVALGWDLSEPAARRLVKSCAEFFGGDRSTQKPNDLTSRTAGMLAPLQPVSALIVGAGSVGSFIAEVLARHGVGRLTLVDPDIVEPANLSRTTYEWSDVGDSKVAALERRLRRIRPDAHIDGHACDVASLGSEWVAENVESHDVVVCATDDMAAQGMLNAFAWHAGTPAVFPAVYREARAGEIVISVPRPSGVCWRCTVLGSVETTAGERPHDYGTGRIAAATALGADVWTLSAVASKLVLSLLHISAGGDGPLASFVASPLAWGTTLLQVATSPKWGVFETWFSSAPGQWAYQSVWSTPTGDAQCPVCGNHPTSPRIDRALREQDRQRLFELIGPERGEP